MSELEPLPPLSDAQMEIMNVVWDRGEVDGRGCLEVAGGPAEGRAEHGPHDAHAAGREGLAVLRRGRPRLPLPGGGAARGDPRARWSAGWSTRRSAARPRGWSWPCCTAEASRRRKPAGSRR